jgi:dolichol-phosphate mannosyltransferase
MRTQPAQAIDGTAGAVFSGHSMTKAMVSGVPAGSQDGHPAAADRRSNELHGPARVPLLVVVPTYDEAGNVGALVSRIDALGAGRDFDVLVVDDSSPDGTAGLVRRLSAGRPWLHLLERDGRRGLGSAYRDGFRWGLSHGYTYLGEMDADLSHDPADLPRLQETAVDADVVLGSRYVPGGRTEGWPWKRRLLSRAANAYARALLGAGIKDVTSGFRVYSRRAVELLLQAGARCDGYGFQVEGIWIASRSGLSIREIPIAFRNRELGVSKMSARIALEAARRCLVMAFTRPAIAGGAGPRPGPFHAEAELALRTGSPVGAVRA